MGDTLAVGDILILLFIVTEDVEVANRFCNVWQSAPDAYCY